MSDEIYKKVVTWLRTRTPLKSESISITPETETYADLEIYGDDLFEFLIWINDEFVQVTVAGGKYAPSIDLGDRTIIPDGFIPGQSLSEVKNVGSLSFTNQLRTYSDFAQKNDLRFDLYTRPGATFSRPLQNAFDSGLINRLDIPR